jgi:hypothetical protein
VAKTNTQAQAGTPKFLKCEGCGQAISWADTTCATCKRPLGFPNVRDAERPDEEAELARKYEAARESCTARECIDVLDKFSLSLAESKAVICRGFGTLAEWVLNANRHYKSFYLQIADDGRVPENNYYDKIRGAVDERLFPLYKDNMCFASLALPETSFNGFGEYRVTLKTPTISGRSSVFWGNTIEFAKNYKVQLTGPLPRGHRATWSKRALLCCAKLHGQLDKLTTPEQFGQVLGRAEAGSGDADIIEVHVFGDVRRECIELVEGPKPTSQADKVLANRIKKEVERWAGTAEFL